MIVYKAVRVTTRREHHSGSTVFTRYWSTYARGDYLVEYIPGVLMLGYKSTPLFAYKTFQAAKEQHFLNIATGDTQIWEAETGSVLPGPGYLYRHVYDWNTFWQVYYERKGRIERASDLPGDYMQIMFDSTQEAVLCPGGLTLLKQVEPITSSVHAST